MVLQGRGGEGFGTGEPLLKEALRGQRSAYNLLFSNEVGLFIHCITAA